MAAGLLDGKRLAAEIKDELRNRVAALTATGHTPGLGTVLVGDDPGSRLYVDGKHRDCQQVGIESLRIDLPDDATRDDVLAAVDRLNTEPRCTAYIVQLPLPQSLDQFEVIDRIDPTKDADGLHPVNLGRLVLGADCPLPCTPAGIVRLLGSYDIPLAGAHVCVVGRGITVGRSLGLLFSQRSANATVTLCHTGTRDLATEVRRADIVVAAAGVPGLVQPDMVKSGAVLVDVGVSRGPDGKVAGDIDSAAGTHAAWRSPNPGGVGPMTRAMLLDNVVRAAERAATGAPPPLR